MYRRTWIKMWVKMLRDQEFMSMNESQRFIWIGLLLLAGDNAITGKICVMDEMGYTMDQISALLNTDSETLKGTLDILISQERITISDRNVISIINWEKYQSEYSRQVKYRKKGYKSRLQSKVTENSSPSLSNSSILDTSILDTNILSNKQLNNYFNEIWQKYPKRVGRKSAERHFRASVKTPGDWVNIQKALQNYINCDTVKKGFIQNGSTWFNDWESWINQGNPIPEAKPLTKEEIQKAKQASDEYIRNLRRNQ